MNETANADDNSDPVEQQFREAYALAGEANKTLAEARDAVRKVRQARGYFAPESMSGKGISGSPSSSPHRGSSGGFSKGESFGKSKKGLGTMFHLWHAWSHVQFMSRQIFQRKRQDWT